MHAAFWCIASQCTADIEEITIAANLLEMFQGIVEIGDDLDIRGNIRTGSILLENMTIAGAD